MTSGTRSTARGTLRRRRNMRYIARNPTCACLSRVGQPEIVGAWQNPAAPPSPQRERFCLFFGVQGDLKKEIKKLQRLLEKKHTVVKNLRVYMYL
eukprot:SAG22_NODE_4421_length_1274_cov_3.954894_1_plen_95_part_00